MAEPEEFEQKTTATIAEAFDVMVEASGIVKRNANFLSKVVRPLIWVVVINAIVSVTLPIQMVFRDERIEKLEGSVQTLNQDVHTMQKAADDAKTASTEAKVAAEAAKTALDNAIAASQTSGEESREAIELINQIYKICVEQKEC